MRHASSAFASAPSLSGINAPRADSSARTRSERARRTAAANRSTSMRHARPSVAHALTASRHAGRSSVASRPGTVCVR
ncbi:hypothetical protein [Actinomyces oris]|uniref:hypothetical protein n=1 Tax=Actinomyces oris TaxID=544580 RepID=UPI0026EAB5AD|nr:hypothetical protein [Actinomyces oris]